MQSIARKIRQSCQPRVAAFPPIRFPAASYGTLGRIRPNATSGSRGRAVARTTAWSANIVRLGLISLLIMGCGSDRAVVTELDPDGQADVSEVSEVSEVSNDEPAEGGIPCASGLTSCRGICIDLQTTLGHCGACGAACAAGEECMLGTCAPVCCTGKALCGGNCIDQLSSNNHCGGCDNKCDGSKGFACSQGQCQCATDREACGGECTDTHSDPNNCGSCGIACHQDKACIQGFCTCPDGTSDCGGTSPQCFDLQVDPWACGSPCGLMCADKYCLPTAGGTWACDFCSTNGQTNCGNQCVDLATDPANCGACATACSGVQSCSLGVCG
jgi:hypothetical protein